MAQTPHEKSKVLTQAYKGKFVLIIEEGKGKNSYYVGLLDYVGFNQKEDEWHRVHLNKHFYLNDKSNKWNSFNPFDYLITIASDEVTVPSNIAIPSRYSLFLGDGSVYLFKTKEALNAWLEHMHPDVPKVTV